MASESLRLGLSHQLARPVSGDMTAAQLGSGQVEVLATPVMISLMELASWQAVQGALEPGMTTVGARVDVRHLAPTTVGDVLTVRSSLTEVDGRRLVFRVEAWDTAGRVGEGVHERFVVPLYRFLEGALRRRSQPAG